MARITINSSDALAAAAKVRATEKFQSVSQYVQQLIAQDLAEQKKQKGMVEENQAPYGDDPETGLKPKNPKL